MSEEKLLQVRNRILRGLEAVQGIRRPPPLVQLVVLDPAFAGRAERVGIEAAVIPLAAVRVRPTSLAWAESGAGPSLAESVDWLERTLRLELTQGDQVAVLELDLLAWEFLERAADGLEASAFYAAEVRRLMRELSKLTESPGGEQSAVGVITPAGRQQLVFDIGDRITIAPA